MKNFKIKKILIIGLGLIGGSFAKAIREKNIAQQIFALDQDLEAINNARNQKIVDDFCLIDSQIKDYDLIVIACPLKNYPQIFTQLANHLDNKNLVIDLGSIKNFDNKLLKLIPNFIGCHPIAGSDQSGYLNSDCNLFFGKKFVICNYNNIDSVKIVKEIIIEIGSSFIELSASKHDEIFALTSHLPQFLSFLCAEFSPKKNKNEFIKKAFRLDKSSPEIWSDIFKLNEKNLEKFYQQFFTNFTNIAKQLKSFSTSKQFLTTNNIFIKESKALKITDLEPDFSQIFFRLLVVLSYLKIDKINDYLEYTGSGFADFTSIAFISQLNHLDLDSLIKKNLPEINKFLDKFFE
ncbi:prephenate dehydrogenase [Alphaproteobacteria bacterium]|nr:prephenate dehydrogenase [Alphaproteobacteria bacterium]